MVAAPVKTPVWRENLGMHTQTCTLTHRRPARNHMDGSSMRAWLGPTKVLYLREFVVCVFIGTLRYYLSGSVWPRSPLDNQSLVCHCRSAIIVLWFHTLCQQDFFNVLRKFGRFLLIGSTYHISAKTLHCWRVIRTSRLFRCPLTAPYLCRMARLVKRGSWTASVLSSIHTEEDFHLGL